MNITVTSLDYKQFKSMTTSEAAGTVNTSSLFIIMSKKLQFLKFYNVVMFSLLGRLIVSNDTALYVYRQLKQQPPRLGLIK